MSRPQRLPGNAAPIALGGLNELGVWPIAIGSIDCITQGAVKPFFRYVTTVVETIKCRRRCARSTFIVDCLVFGSCLVARLLVLSRCLLVLVSFCQGFSIVWASSRLGTNLIISFAVTSVGFAPARNTSNASASMSLTK